MPHSKTVGLSHLVPVTLAAFVLSCTLVAQDPKSWRERIQAGEATAVLAEIEALVASDSDSLEACLVGAEAALEARRFDRAGSLADRAKKLAPEDPRPFLLDGHAEFYRGLAERERGGSLFTASTFRTAALFYSRARERGADVWTASWFEAEALAGAEDWRGARKALRIARRERPEDPATLEFEARVILELAQREPDPQLVQAAAAAADRALAIAPTFEAAALRRFEAALLANKRSEIRPEFVRLAQAFPASEALFDLLLTKFRGDVPPTFLKQTLLATAAAVPTESSALTRWYLGYVAELERDWARALDAYRAFLALRPRHPRALFKIGWQLGRLGKLDEAQGALLAAKNLGGLDGGDLLAAMRFIVGEYATRSRYAEAAALQREVVGGGGSPRDRMDLGLLLYNLGQREEGLALYREVTELTDAAPALRATAWNNLGLGLQGLGRLKPAEAAFRQSLAELGTGNLDALENLGVLLLESGRGSEAIPLFRQALAGDPLRHRSQYHLLRALDPRGLGN